MSFKKGDKVLVNTLLAIRGEIISCEEKDFPKVKVRFEYINEPVEVSIDSINLADEETSSEIKDIRLSPIEFQKFAERQLELMGISTKNDNDLS